MSQLFEFPSGHTIDLNQVFLVSPVTHAPLGSCFKIEIERRGSENQYEFCLAKYGPNKTQAEARRIAETVREQLIAKWSSK